MKLNLILANNGVSKIATDDVEVAVAWADLARKYS